MKNSLSIITVNFNNVSGLERTLKSVNSLEINYEHIIVDGCSSDDSCRLIREYSKSRTNVVFIIDPDQGPYDAMNKGLDLSSGDFVWFLNSGDEFTGKRFPVTEFSRDHLLALPVYRIARYGAYRKKIKYKFRDIRITMPYNHQGIIFPKTDLRFDLTYEIAADYDFICKHGLPLKKSERSELTVLYEGGGLSYIKSFEKYNELHDIALKFSKNNINKFLIVVYYLYKKMRYRIYEFIF